MSDTSEKMLTDDEVTQSKEDTAAEVTASEKALEAKLKAKYPTSGGLSGHSAFLQKKLAKGTKYFDSGDYQMARQTLPNLQQKSRIAPSITSVLMSTGQAIPTPESVPIRKTSIIHSKYQQTTTVAQNPPPPPSSTS